MCGLLGVAGAIGIKQETVFKQLLVVDSLRGTDSTGIATIGKANGNVKVAKQLGDPYNLFSDKRFDSAMGGVHKAIIGHNRWATSGGITRTSAHPFEFDTLVGAHNGTLNNKHDLLDHSQFKVDSENLFHQIEQDGLHNTMKIVRGAWTLVWWDKHMHTMNFLRNKERPLSLAVSKGGKGLYWASEGWMLAGVLGREGIEREDIWSLPEDMHLSFEIDDKGEISKPVITECKGAPLFTMVKEVKTQASTMPIGIKQPDGSYISQIGDPITDNPLRPDLKPIGQKYADYTKNLDHDYKGKKGVLFEVLCKARDSQGGDYVMLFDPKAQDKEVRLYLHSCHSVETMIGQDIRAEVRDFCGSKDGGYYKVNPWSVQEVGDISIDDLVRSSPTTFKNRNGIALSRQDWMGLYSTCDCCDNALVPEEKNRFTTANQTICESCAEDSQFAQYVTFIN